MKVEPFKMERWQSTYENVVKYNLAESGVHPLTVKELIDNEQERIITAALGYGHTNGTPELRSLISQTYRGLTAHNVLVTNGSSEANFISIWHLIKKGDEIALMLPNYMQIAGLARTFGVKVKYFKLQDKKDWTLNIESLKATVSRKTKLIAICNPNNPTGMALSTLEMKAIRDLAHERAR